MQRGEIYDYEPVTRRAQPRLRLVAAQATLDADPPPPVVLCLPITDDDPESLLSPRIGTFGWAVAPNIERTLVSRFTTKVGEAASAEMEQVDVALKAALDLD